MCIRTYVKLSYYGMIVFAWCVMVISFILWFNTTSSPFPSLFSSTMNELVDKFNTAYDRHSRRGGRTATRSLVAVFNHLRIEWCRFVLMCLARRNLGIIFSRKWNILKKEKNINQSDYSLHLISIWLPRLISLGRRKMWFPRALCTCI
jgi:hypothetical protein